MSYTPIDRGSSDWDVPVNAAFTSQDARITTNETSITNINGTLSTHESQIATANTNITSLQNATDALDWQADDQGLIGWTFDPVITTGSAANVSQTLYFVKIPVRKAATITNLIVVVGILGSGLTAGQNLLGLYDSAGTRLGVTADQTTSWGAGTGTKTVPLTSPVAVSAGFYYVAILSNGTTPASFLRGTSQSSSVNNLGGTFRNVNITGQTALPASFTPGSANTDNNARWAAFS